MNKGLRQSNYNPGFINEINATAHNKKDELNINSGAGLFKHTLHRCRLFYWQVNKITMSNIVQVVNVDKNMTSLKKGVNASGLDQVLSSTGPFTVFAPTDIAFGKLDKGVLDNLLKPENKTKLADVLNHHVVSGKINFKDLKDVEILKTVNGKEQLVHIQVGHLTVDGIKIISHDMQATNGVIHSLETTIIKN